MNISELLFGRKCFPERIDSRHICGKRLNVSKSLFRKTLFGHHGCVNTLSFSKSERIFATSGDDRRVLLWDTEKCIGGRHPKHVVEMCSKHDSNVFTTCFNSDESVVLSGGNDERVLSHDVQTNTLIGDFTFEGTEVLFIDSHPSLPSQSMAGASCGKLITIDQRIGQNGGGTGRAPHSTTVVRDDCIYSSFRCVKYLPSDPTYIATANSINGLALRDTRMDKNKVVMQYRNRSRRFASAESGDMMHCTFDATGTRLLALSGRESTLYLFDLDCPDEPKFTFASRAFFKSATTIKVCSFMGPNDEYVVCGSNDFNVYVWKIPKDGAFKHVRIPHMQLRGHRSIVNQVSYAKRFSLLATSGTEKIVKIWSPFWINHGMGSIEKEVGVTRKVRYNYDDYLNFILHEGPIDHDYQFGTTEEDQRILALFDLERGGEDGDGDYNHDNDPAVEEGAPSEFNSATAYLDGLNAPGQPGSSSSTGGDASDDLYSFDWPHSEQSNSEPDHEPNLIGLDSSLDSISPTHGDDPTFAILNEQISSANTPGSSMSRLRGSTSDTSSDEGSESTVVRMRNASRKSKRKK